MKKLLFALVAIIVIPVLVVAVIVFSGGSYLSPGAEDVIEDVLKSDPADELPGETGHADSSGVFIWYKSIAPEGPSKGDILLVSGIASDSLWWPPCFIRSLRSSGYRVIIFDNRSTGLSDWVKERPGWRYSIGDLARDGVAVLDALKIKRAHVAGVSMGGMIAQQMAISWPGRVKSLVSIMSSGNIEDRELPAVPWKTVLNVMRISARYGLFKSEKNIIRLHLAIWQLFRNETLAMEDVRSISERVHFNIKERRGYNTSAFSRQLYAILSSPERHSGLRGLRMPALFIHGKRDPLIPYLHGVKCSKSASGSALLLIDEMGHDIPCSYSGTVAARIAGFISSAR